MTEFLRVRDKSTRHEYTIPAAAFREDAHERVTRKGAEAVDSVGRPLPAKYRTQTSPASASESTSTTDNEESRE